MKNILYILLLSFSVSQSYGQSDPCDTGSENSCMCETAEVLTCDGDLDGYQGSMSTYQHPDDGPDPMCAGSQGNNTASHNPTWFAFVAESTDLTLEVAYTDCIATNVCDTTFFDPTFGIQAAVYSDCSIDPASAIACDANPVDCEEEGVRVLEMTELIIGSTYYVIVDGCCGSACEVEITVIGDCINLDVPVAQFSTDTPNGCAEFTLEFIDESTNNPTEWSWTFEGGNPATSTEQNPTVVYTAAGTFDVELTVSNAAGNTSIFEVDYITVNDVPTANFVSSNNLQ